MDSLLLVGIYELSLTQGILIPIIYLSAFLIFGVIEGRTGIRDEDYYNQFNKVKPLKSMIPLILKDGEKRELTNQEKLIVRRNDWKAVNEIITKRVEG